MKYSTLGARFGAALIDLAIFLPFFFITLAFHGNYYSTLVLIFPVFLFMTSYYVYFHGSTGQTLGKKLAKLKVVRLDGSPITYKTAFIRYSVDFGAAALSAAALFSVVYGIGQEQYELFFKDGLFSDGAKSYYQILEEHRIYSSVEIFENAWLFAQLACLLITSERRAAHDFVAGTVVVDISQDEEKREL